jgi:hypothetical protein
MRAERCSTRQDNMVTQKRDHATLRDTLNTYDCPPRQAAL